MPSLNELRPFILFPPGRFITDRLEHRNWNQEELATVLGITPTHLSQVMKGESPLTYDMAQRLGATFDTSAQFWTNLYLNYAQWKDEENPGLTETEIRSSIYERMPVKDMVKKKWLKPSKTVKDLEKQALTYWDIKKLDFTFIDEKFTPCLNRKSEAYNQFNASYAATWYRKAQLVAKEYKVPAYSEAKLSTLASALHSFTPDEANIPEFINGLNACGVKFFVLPHLEKTYLDGAAFMDGKHPVVVYTARYKRIDNFWFTVAHEIAHVLKHLGPNCPFVLDDLKRGDVDRLEKEANQLASKWLKHVEAIDWIKENTRAYLTQTAVLDCAEAVGIHPSIIIGALSHAGTISHRNLHLFNSNVLEFIPKEHQY
jgi:HTH-type transcriptional regulator/antitoxin HigA